MTETTELDLAHAAIGRGGDAERLRFYERIADQELFVLLDAEPVGDAIRPSVFALEEGSYVLAFDREERLADFADAPAPYAALPGRVIAAMLARQGLGLGLNLGVAPSETLLSAEAVAWLTETLGTSPVEAEARPRSFHAPKGMPEALVAALDAKLARMAGLADHASLAGVRYDDDRQGHILGFVGAKPGAEAALAKAVGEALVFSGIEAGELDVAFFGPGDTAAAGIEAAGLRFDLPEPVSARAPTPAAPGMDPKRPPRLR